MDADVRRAARALDRHGLAHAYGHVSTRVDAERFLVTPSRPLSCMQLDTPLVACGVHRELPDGALPEVRMHQHIYRTRPDVGGICRFQSPSVLALSALRRTPRALHGLSAYFAPQPPLWDDPTLVRDDDTASGVASALGHARAIVLRGNGAVTVGDTVREAACHAFYLEDAAKLELAIGTQEATPYTAEQCAARTADKTLYLRMWDFLTRDAVVREEARS